MTATKALRTEHEYILAMIACLRAACDELVNNDRFDAETFQNGVDFIRSYADSWHHAKEEEILFPAMEASGIPREGGPIAVMLHEHVIGRSYVAKISENLQAAINGDSEARQRIKSYAIAYSELLTQHIQKENNILFDMADQLFSAEEHEYLVNQYEEAVPEGADQSTGAIYENAVLELCEKWNIDPQEAARVGNTFQCH